MIPEEEIFTNIREMGYITVTPIKIWPSYYKLADGTIIRALVNINYLLSNPSSPEGFTVNSNNSVNAYVSKEKRHPEKFEEYNPSDLQSGVIDVDVEFEVLRENFSVYEMSNKMKISVKTVVGQIRKTKFYTKEGEPVYIISPNPIIKTKMI